MNNLEKVTWVIRGPIYEYSYILRYIYIGWTLELVLITGHPVVKSNHFNLKNEITF